MAAKPSPATPAKPRASSAGKPGKKQGLETTAQEVNIGAARYMADFVRGSIGPRGMAKLLSAGRGGVLVTTEGGTLLKSMDITHPISKVITELSTTVDTEVGDGTSSAVLLVSAMLDGAEELMRKGMHPTAIVEGYMMAVAKATEAIGAISETIAPMNREWLLRVARTSIETRLVSKESPRLAELAVDAVTSIAEKVDGGYRVDAKEVKVEKKHGGSLAETSLVRGIAVQNEVGFPGMPERVEDAKVALLSVPLRVKKPKFDAKLNMNNPAMMKRFMDEDAKMLRALVDKIASSGANVLFCERMIDLAAFEDLVRAGILTLRRTKEADMLSISRATGARIVTSVSDISAADLGRARLVEQRIIQNEKWIFVEGVKDPRAMTIIVRGANLTLLDEAARGIKRAVMAAKDVVEKPAVVPGGGAPEAEAARVVKEWAWGLAGRRQLAALKFADALEAIPSTLAANSGMNVLDAMIEVRAKHAEGMASFGVDAMERKIGDMKAKEVYDPLVVKQYVLRAATEVACLILRIGTEIKTGKPGKKKRSEFASWSGLGRKPKRQ